MQQKKALCGYTIMRIRMMQKERKKMPQAIQMPLKSSEYEVQIVNTIANITLVQTFQNPTNKYLELQYCFPVNPNACVYRFLAEFGAKKIEGVIREKEQAKKEFQQAVQSGKQAALGEIDSEEGDTLNLQVGNVGPHQIVKIQISYLQELSLTANIFYELHMPGTITPKYMSSLSKEQIRHGYRNKVAKAKGQFYWDFKIILKTSKKVSFFDSKSHDIKLVSQNDTQTESILEMVQSCIPNKDFFFTFTTENYQLPSYVFGRTDYSSTAMISFVPKFCELNIDDAYKASVLGTPIDTDIDNAKGEYIFLLDRSGSMKGKRIDKAKEALTLFVKSLPQDAFFNIISFGRGSKCLFPQSVKYNDKSIEKAIKQVKKMSADMGGTQIYQVLTQLMSQKPIQGYPKHIFLLTDGAVSNTTTIVDMIEGNNKYSRVHTIGIGNGASEQLIIECAKKGKGRHVFISDSQDPSEKIIQLLTDSLSPLITKMKLSYDKNVIESIIPNPSSLPYILKDEIVNFFINFKGHLDKKTKIAFQYEDSLNKKPYASQIQVDPQLGNQSFIDKMGHFKKIRMLESSLKNNTNIEEHIYYVKKIDRKAQIIDLSLKHQILSRHTAFLSVQKELVDGKYQQIKSVGQIKVEVQNVKPVEKQFKKEKSSAVVMKSLCSTVSKKLQQIEPRFNMVPAKLPTKKNALIITSKVSLHQKFQPDNKPQKRRVECADAPESQITMKRKKQIKTQTLIKEKQPAYSSKTINKQDIDINDVISYQLSNGSWDAIELVEKLYGVKKMKQLFSEKALWEIRQIVITLLVCKWIEMHHPSKQYNLVVKKGYNFTKKVEQKSIELIQEQLNIIGV